MDTGLSLVELTFTHRSLVQACGPTPECSSCPSPLPQQAPAPFPLPHTGTRSFSPSVPSFLILDQNLPIDKQYAASLVVQWERISLAVKGTKDQSVAPEDPTCLGATKPVLHNYFRAQKPQLLSPHATATEAPSP